MEGKEGNEGEAKHGTMAGEEPEIEEDNEPAAARTDTSESAPGEGNECGDQAKEGEETAPLQTDDN